MRARSLGPRNNPASTVDDAPPSNARLDRAAPLGKPLVPEVWNTAIVAVGSMAVGGKSRRFRFGRARIHPCVSVPSSACIQVRTLQRVAVHDLALEDRSSVTRISVPLLARMRRTSDSESMRVQRNRDASGADDGQKPMKAVPVVAAIHGNGLAGAQRDCSAEKCINAADIRVQFGQMIRPVVLDADFAITVARAATHPRDLPP